MVVAVIFVNIWEVIKALNKVGDFGENYNKMVRVLLALDDGK